MRHEEENITMAITSSSPLATVVAVFCFMTIGINFVVCYQIYRRRSLRSSCTGLIVANLAVVDILVSLKDLPLLVSVSMTGRWYFEEHWCRSYGLTNVIYIIVSVSTLVTISTEQYFTATNSGKQGNSNRPALLGYIIAHTTMSYSLSLLWSKYVFITRKAFCQVDWPPSGLTFTLIASVIFLMPVSFLVYNLFNQGNDEIQEEKSKQQLLEQSKDDSDDDGEADYSQIRLQFAVGLFLISWCPYVLESFFSISDDVPNLVGLSCAFIPIFTTTLIPFWYLKWRRQMERIAQPKAFILQC
ncbi:melanopsin-A-like [Actinia tenebrosa]|uniref:Melanopsin-A-like n=1 Tax=Actinia tenebrosa TaxID=6105 RepID=A0A6P8ISJ6_ACTTE|nr:melanopsin-A-like [Actinia tenebrosa]